MSKVIHGEGKPRIVASTAVLFSGSVDAHSVADKRLTINSLTGFNALWASGYLVEVQDQAGNIIITQTTSYDLINKYIYYDELFGGDGSDLEVASASAFIRILGQVVDLPYCQSLVETFALDAIQKKLRTGEIVTKRRGWYYSAQLSYTQYFKYTDLQSLQPLFDNDQDSFRFYPRKDNPAIYYTVNFPEDYSLSLAQRPFHTHHKLVELQLIGVERLTEVDLTSTATDLKGYGEYYGYYN